jgi:hypothetical protein
MSYSSITTNLGLRVWSGSDEFDPADLAFNWSAIDADYTRPRSADRVEILATVPGVGNFDGRLVFLTAAVSGFPAKTMIRYNGTSGTWAAVGPSPEILGSLPTVSNYAGRIVVLSSAAGGFAQWDVVVNTDGANAWQKVGGMTVSATLPVSPTAGQVVMLTSATGGFEAFDLVVYTGSIWQRTSRRGVEVGSALPGSPYAGQVFVLSSAASGFSAWDVVRYNGSTWGRVAGNDIQVAATLPTSPINGQVFVLSNAASGFNAYDVVRYDGSVSAWERISNVNQPYAGYVAGKTSSSLGGTQAILVPIEIQNRITVSTIYYDVTIAAGNFDVGIYTPGGTLVVSKGAGAVSGTGMQGSTIAATALASGRYWLGISCSTSSLEIRGDPTSLLRVFCRQVNLGNYLLPSTITVGATIPSFVPNLAIPL